MDPFTAKHKMRAIIYELKAKLTPDTDLAWTRYRNVNEVTEMLDQFDERIQKHDTAALDELALLFAPTAPFQEISISNGWSEEFLNIAKLFDRTFIDLKKEWK